jgi:hypothetical protein
MLSKQYEKPTNEKNKCIFCTRILTANESFFNGNYCIICKIKYDLNLKNETTNKKYESHKVF